MARQTGLSRLKKGLDDTGLYRSGDGKLALMKPASSLEIIAAGSAYWSTREKAAEFTCAAAAARLMGPTFHVKFFSTLNGLTSG